MQLPNIESRWLDSQIEAQNARAKDRESVNTLLATESDSVARMELEQSAIASIDEKVKALALVCQSNCKQGIEQLVTRCLDAVFPENAYQFGLVFEKKRDQTEARCVLTDRNEETYDLHNAVEGGALDVISFALRLATLTLTKPQPSKLLVLDEPFRCVSASHRGRLAALLETLATEYGFQIIMITHITELARGNTIEI
jgi:energy-coupling factor transporter ATP-binding protein EcfA2